jgi:hypothetical protein
MLRHAASTFTSPARARGKLKPIICRPAKGKDDVSDFFAIIDYVGYELSGQWIRSQTDRFFLARFPTLGTSNPHQALLVLVGITTAPVSRRSH